MKEGWTYKKFADCIDKVPKQKQVKSKDYQPFGKYPIVSQEKELISGYWDDESCLYKHKKPVIVFGDHTKEIKYVDFDFVVGADGTQILSPKEGIDAKFFYYALLATPIRTLGYARHFKLLKEKSFIMPSVSDQLSIVARLDAAFAHIDALKANAEKQLTEASQHFQAELTECMRQKEGWEEKKLGEVCEVISGQSPEGKFYNTEGNGTPFYQGKKDFTLKYVGTPTMWTTEVTKLAEKDDILMSVRAPVGDVNFATQKICIGRGLAAIRTKRTIDKGYLFYYLVAKKSSIKGKEGVGFASINRKEIMDIDIQFPNDISEQRQIVSRLDALSANIKKLEEVQRKTLAECDALKQAMLREVFE